MPIKAYVPSSPPLRPTHIGGLPPRRISALIIEEDLSDIDSSDSSWFLPANLYETITISQKEVPADSDSIIGSNFESNLNQNLDIPTAADTSRRPSISLARLHTPCIDDVEIKLPNYDYVHSASGSVKHSSASRRGSNSEVFFHSPLRRTRTYSEYSSSATSSTASGYESPVFYPDSDYGCDDDCGCDDEQHESVVSKSAKSQPIQVPSGGSKRRRRGCFVHNDTKRTMSDEDAIMDDSDDDDCDFDEVPIDDWVQFAYRPSSNFETALITEVVRRRKSDEHFASLKSQGISYEKELENAQFSESHRRSQWMKDMVRWYPQECGGGHVLPCIN
ncbi:hypothetical protein H072_10719 [Dactylellina haptotyla CBS 200.50]|uniref:Uncharacterized protein n=1 Tax=Dactylellina haptotyla (strain CBS 200.50) TaxID=1284197 RepID=S8B9M1_DACHA|nr:hypothetical protein H072_10719 [Dactylellina haptotyla CBS 200.50]